VNCFNGERNCTNIENFKTKVFLTEVAATSTNKHIPGGLKGSVAIPDDFNDPL
jgi:hypothetical protein